MRVKLVCDILSNELIVYLAPKHRGFAFVTFSSSADAQDAIDNMDMNELKGRVLKVNLARPMKAALNPQGNRASAYACLWDQSWVLGG